MKSFFKCLFFLLIVSNGNSQQLVMRGDHADPSVVKIDDTYWASATTSNWFPAYPLLKSKDLVNWQQQGYVFTKKPDWVDYYFWAPEITYENGKVYIYYSAHKKGGNLCVGIASADKPEGPYTDHGPIICQTVGSIDAFPMRDEKGKLYMIWKEDGNSVGQPTPIWAQELNEERTALVGEKKELFRNDKPWEGNLVEGVSMIKNGDYYYAFYAAAACCGRECTYKTGVARAKNLLGPWEKYNKNPILENDEEWKCPGHGTPIEKNGKYYFLYHAYDNETSVYTGREGMLIEFRFTPDGWIEFVKENESKDVALTSITDKFRGNQLAQHWQWSVFQPVTYTQSGGELQLAAMPSPSGAYVGIKTTSGNYTATVRVRPGQTTAAAGLGAIGDDNNTIGAYYKDGLVRVVQLRDGKETELAQKNVARGKNLYLKMQVANGKDISFLYSTRGKRFQPLNEKVADGGYLPPWDRAIRVGLLSKGDASQRATFDRFQLQNQ